MLAPFSLKKVFSSPSGLVTWHLAIGLNAIELPAGVAHLDPSLPTWMELLSRLVAALQLTSRWRRERRKVVASYRATLSWSIGENLRNAQKSIRTNDFCKVARYKNDMRISVLFLYGTSVQTEKAIDETILFTIAPKRI